MKKRLSIDIETFSRCDLKKAGAAVYGEHGSTQILCVMYAVDDGPVEEWLPGQDIAPRWATHPEEYTFCAWNAAFEWSVMTHHGYTSWVKFPPLDEWDDTMLRAGAMSLPMSLDACAKAMGLSITKDADGYAVMMKLCKPNAKGEQITYDSPAMTFKGEKKTGAELFEMLYKYCANDVEVERMIAGKIPPLSEHERQVCAVNTRINQRGVYINAHEIQKIIRYYEPEAETLKTEMKAATGLDNPNSNTQFHQWLMSHGVDVPNVQAATMAEVHDAADTPDAVRHAVSLRMALQRKATDKYTGMLAMATADSRVRHVHTYHGAHTGRFASRGINLQNMHRPTFGDVDACIESLALPEWVDMLWGAPTDVWGSRTEVACTLTRSAIQAAPGNVLLVSDYSAIEARVLAWLAGMADTVKVFTTHGKLYEHTAAGIYRKHIDDVDKEERFIGKVACIAEGQKVLTDVGEISIQYVSIHDRVWDGDQFVEHDGAIYQGEKEVIEYDGVIATPDHEVFIENGQRKIPLERCAAEQIRITPAGFSWQGDRSRRNIFSGSGMGERVQTRSSQMHGVQRREHSFDGQPHGWADAGLSGMREPQARTSLAGSTNNLDETALPQPQRSKLSLLRWTRDMFSFLFRAFLRGVHSGKFGALPGKADRSDRQRRGLCAGQSTVGNRAGQYEQSTLHQNPLVQRVSFEAPRMPLRRQHTAQHAIERAHLPRDSSSMEPVQLQAKRRVWDILNAGPRNRFTVNGKLVSNCLALGYGGAEGAFLQMARAYGVKELDMDITGEIVQPWRAANKMAVKFWHEIERAAKRAIRDPGSVHEYRGIRCKHARGALRIRLPSGRCLHYWGAWLGEGRYGEEIKFWGVDSKTRRWGRMSTYGGKLTENIVQAIARDILAFALVNLEAADFPVVLHVHDEIVAEVPESRAGELAEMERIMCRLPDWAEGLPLAAEGGVMKRYQKT